MQVCGLHIYPVKSCAGLSVPRMQLDRFGPSGDRRWLVVGKDAVFLSQRELPRLALITVQPTATGLRLSCGGESVVSAVPDTAERVAVTVWEDTVSAIDCGDVAAQWLCEQLGRSARLVYMPDDSERLVDTDYAHAGETVSFADGFPLLLISQESLQELNRRLPSAVPMNRFRPNLVISGCEPHAEDSWRQIRVGEVIFDIAKPCARCTVPSIDQGSAAKDPDILRVLSSYRRGDDRQIYFGQNLLYRGAGEVALGDPVEILA